MRGIDEMFSKYLLRFPHLNSWIIFDDIEFIDSIYKKR